MTGGEILDVPLTEEQRRPLIDVDGRRQLNFLLEHERAPRYNHICGDRLTAAGLAAVQALDGETRTAAPFVPGAPPAWVAEFVARCVATVPVYRRHGPAPARLVDVPTVSRADLVAAPWSFVPDDHPLDNMVVFTTTGTGGGHLAYIPSTPEATAAYAVMLRAALRTRELTLDGGPGRTAVAQVCWQRRTYTYASVSSFLGQAGIVKLNLNPSEWNDPADVGRFLDAIAPEVVTGDPVAFAHLADVPTTMRPKALLSSAMALLPGLRDELESRFGCPVIDIYGMNESGPIAASTPDGTAHTLLQPRLYVEVLDEAGEPCPLGTRGEITLTGGFNAALPLLRYRTGDHAALELRGRTPVLAGLAGRAPVAFVTADGRAMNTIDVSVAFAPFTFGRYSIHQRADRSLRVGVEPLAALDEPRVRAELATLFGPVPVEFADLVGEPERPVYSVDPDAG